MDGKKRLWSQKINDDIKSANITSNDLAGMDGHLYDAS